MVGSGLLVAVVLGGVAVGVRQRSVAEARAEVAQVRQARADAGHALAAVSRPIREGAGSLTAEERLELMRLRSEVTDLKERQRALSPLTNRTTGLQQKLAALTNAAAGRMPQGYIRRADARNRGAATPEAAFETFLWAVEHRDVEVMLSLVPVQGAESMRQQLAKGGADKLFEDMPPFPGYRVAGREESGPDQVTLWLEMAPGQEVPMHMGREQGTWRIGR
jgi:hypothetical protein